MAAATLLHAPVSSRERVHAHFLPVTAPRAVKPPPALRHSDHGCDDDCGVLAESDTPASSARSSLDSRLELSLVRVPLPDGHAAFLRKALGKLKPGQCLPASRQVRHLGRGGVGEVHLLEVDVPGAAAPVRLAKKVVHCKRYDAARHAREVAAMQAAAASPFTLRVYGSSAPGKAPFALYLEYAPLGSLHELITRRRRAVGRAPYFSDDEVRWVGARLLAALAHLHAAGVVHRDVSSQNIYRSATGAPLLADFDAAGLLDAEGLVYGPSQGRLAVAAPEVRAAAYGGGPYGSKADLYSLGAVLLEMVTDREPADDPPLEGCCGALRELLLQRLLVHQSKRLDAAGAMQHQFFEGVDWERLEFESPPPGLAGDGI